MKQPLKRLPLRTYYGGIELSTQSEDLLLEAMNRLKTEDPDEAIQVALKAFLNDERRSETGRHGLGEKSF